MTGKKKKNNNRDDAKTGVEAGADKPYRVKSVEKQSKYTVILELDKKYKGTGDTFQEAFNDMGLTWDMIKLNGNLVVKKGKKKEEQFMRPFEVRRLINNKIMRDIWAERFEYRLQ